MITSYETQAVSNAMIQEIVAQEIRRQKSARERALEREVNDLQMQLDIRRYRDATIYPKYVDVTDRLYRAPEHSWISDAWWALVGWTCLIFGALYDALWT